MMRDLIPFCPILVFKTNLKNKIKQKNTAEEYFRFSVSPEKNPTKQTNKNTLGHLM